MMSLPVLLSIPHGGMDVPIELLGRVCLERADLFDDSDAYSREIYDLGERVAAVISTGIARAFIDLNRAPDDLPAQNPDGVVKSHTCYGKAIYCKDAQPDENLVKRLLDKYYFSYHRRIKNILSGDDPLPELALDCHSMAAVGPAISPDKGKKRPMICLGDVRGTSCPRGKTEQLAACMREAFSLRENEVTINRPFAGGYITRTYGGRPLPWIQVEMNRSLYLRKPFFDRDTLSVNENRLRELGGQFEKALRLYF